MVENVKKQKGDQQLWVQSEAVAFHPSGLSFLLFGYLCFSVVISKRIGHGQSFACLYRPLWTDISMAWGKELTVFVSLSLHNCWERNHALSGVFFYSLQLTNYDGRNTSFIEGCNIILKVCRRFFHILIFKVFNMYCIWYGQRNRMFLATLPTRAAYI